ncbi:chalcone isomerase family protein [Corallincola platygyrae]|uniref:Chalcone isomerase family protein n=1 Tax=Corallincola platygyrae TaxID=1193278 RepID=A0ABW4XQ20_9GAMM
MFGLIKSVAARLFAIAITLSLLLPVSTLKAATGTTTTLLPEPGLEMVGEAKLKVMFWNVYRSRLYTPDGSYQQGQRPIKLEIEYLMDIDAEDLIEKTEDEWRHLKVRNGKQPYWVATLQAMWPNIKEGDRLAIIVDEAGKSLFTHNEVPIGEITDPDFGTSFTDIWLSPNTSRPELRMALLGKSGKGD